ncbi:MAG: magnesium transporter [Limnospira sp. PMC 1291.21]|uniref:Magnesium transporter MgtE n=3 Tax=Limnospira TaxID=2596745 RepID=A0A9P1KL49_9CYAN|nr:MULTISPECIES: magnesium transporter [Limnospira]EKD09414.1 magnesium transporter [Arthrospira platensis C1]MBD2668182.1 magnesium transporter [Arthrospira platensis FACHB-439]MDC0840360.1 magnesium transporter [Limnoraphis robusta]MDY7053171.1 magnesium transporter [Limnospira fusiformis LS22]QJB24772.1 magnesium transporter [Limnospira fusiformis SAG 85.79]RAQ45926.1 magnesium transporter [Arthrospira sp. O9.13F]SPD79480.1 Magnesium transporter MgtE [Arthrospira platensis]
MQEIEEKSSRSELRAIVREQLRLLLEDRNWEGVKTLLLPVQPVDIAEAIDGLPKAMQLTAFRLLSKAEAVEVYEHLSTDIQQSLIEEFRDSELLEIVNSMAPDDRAGLFDELPPRLVRRVLAQLSPEERKATSQLLGYQAGTAGRLMTPEYIALRYNLTIKEASDRIRQLARDREVSYYVYVVDEQRRLMGVASLRDVLLADLDQFLGDIINPDVVFAQTDTDQEEVARSIQRYDLVALPVVDRDHTLVGVVTVDDAIDILQKEATEDIYIMGAVRSEGESYFQSNLATITRKRIPWLFILLITNALTILVMSNFEAVLDEVVALAFFTPLLIDAGGNVGAQSSTVVIRGLSTEELKYKKPLWVIIRESMTGGLLGILLGVVVIGMVFVFLGQIEIGLTVGISLLCITIIAATAGAGLPFLFHSFGLDPALMSSPFITTIVDILGIWIYLSTAKLLLGL